MVFVWGRARRTLKLAGRSSGLLARRLPGSSPGSSARPPPPHHCRRWYPPTTVCALCDEAGDGRHARPAPAVLLLAELAPRSLARAAHQRPILVYVVVGSEHFPATGAARPCVRASASDRKPPRTWEKGKGSAKEKETESGTACSSRPLDIDLGHWAEPQCSNDRVGRRRGSVGGDKESPHHNGDGDGSSACPEAEREAENRKPP
ncbi:hypothetical protein CMUS01_12223 [Colletotrichum musicola]|uniref:Uncharacterized protein n=1 Tax=Colletotrichum musicola TaxID=2175873 RepID=A0A8H6JQ04_9PEZI|nr:hypothetical protein CMUS01_12223 [Colletotrichum musicola]